MRNYFHNACLRGVQATAVMAIALATFSCNQAPVNEQGHSDETTTPAQTVEVTKVTRQDLSHGVTLTAEFKPYQEVEIHAKVAGYVKQINVDVGDHVKAGDIIATLEIPEIEDQLKQADAAILTLLPLALAVGQGSAIQQPLAISIIAGLLLQFPLVLLAMPALIGLTLGPDASDGG